MSIMNFLAIDCIKQKTKRINKAIAMTLSVAMVMGVPVTSSASELEIETPVINFARTNFSLTEQARSMDFNKDWKFALDISGDASGQNFDDSSWRKLNLPHDWSIEQDFTNNVSSEIGHLPGGTGWYRKNFVLPKELEGKRINIDFDGVYMDSYIYVNGKLVGNYPNGYIPFSFDVTDYVVCDGETENVIAVKVTNVTNRGNQSSRWYSGSGIYRDVHLTVTDPVHVGQYGTAIYTPNIESEYSSGNVTVDVTTTVENETPEAVDVVVRNTILDYETSEPLWESVSSEPQTVEADNKSDIKQEISASNPKLWSVETPNLYKMKTEVFVNDELRDTYETRFGFTWSNFDKDKGFSLNSEEMKLYGVCMHHDQGALGAIDNATAIERQMRIMKDMGVNAIRVTHNPASPDLLRICDEMGLMVIEEAFDTWYAGKNRNDYGRFFEARCTYPGVSSDTTWAKFDLQQMIRSNRNYPSIIMWSLGNEIGETNSQKGFNTVKNLIAWAKEIDTEHPVTMGEDKFRINGSATMNDWFVKTANELDVIGMNYAEDNYDHFRKIFPDKPLYGSETSSAVKSRGYYSDPSDSGKNAQDAARYQLSSFDNRAVPWGKTATNSWIPDRNRQWIAGEFIWTGFDYIGEPTPWNQSFTDAPKSSYFGIVDTAGFPKDDYYLYQSQWLDVNENPMVHIFPHWNWEDESIRNKVIDGNGNIPIRVYSNASKVELFVDGVTQGEKAFTKKTTDYGLTYQQQSETSDRLYLEWSLPWEYVEGRTIKAVAKNDAGQTVAEDMIATAGKAAKLSAKVDREIINADGYDLAYITVDVLDDNGNFVPTAMNEINFRISGEGKIVGVDNGDAASWERYKDTDGIWKRSAFNGKAVVIVQSTEKSGSFTLTAQSAGLQQSSVTVYTKQQDLSDDVILGYETTNILTEVGQVPELPTTVKAIYADGRKETVNVTWNEITEEQLSKPAEIVLNGETETGAKVSMIIIVRGPSGIRPISVVTAINVIPQLPKTVTVVWSDGKTETKDIKAWEEITAEQVAEIGTFQVFGTVEGSDDIAVANVRVVEGLEESNVALSSLGSTVSVTYQEGVHLPDHLIDGNLSIENGWGNWNATNRKEDKATITFPQEYNISTVNVWINTRKTWQKPDEITIKYWNGDSFVPVENQSKATDFEGWNSDSQEYKGNEITFDVVKTNKLEFTFKINSYNSGKDMMKITEIQAFSEILPTDSDAKLSDLKVNGETIEGFSPDTTDYFYATDYEAEIPEVSATPQGNATVFVRQPLSNNGTGVVEVTSEDGKNTTIYTIQFGRKDATLKTVELLLPETITQDDIVDLDVKGTLQDGTTVPKNDAIVTYYVEDGTGHAVIKNGQLLAYQPGTVTVYAKMSYMGKEVESDHIEIEIAKNETDKYIVSFDEVEVKTTPGEEPRLPETVIANYNTGLPQELEVEWNVIDSDLYDTLNQFTVEGSVKVNTDVRPVATVNVIDVVAVENFSTAIPEGYEPELPEKVTVYLSDGTEDKGDVVWDTSDTTNIDDITVYNGTVEYFGKTLPVTGTVRVGSGSESDNYVIQRNGYDLPVGMASYTNFNPGSDDSAKNLNDGRTYESGEGKRIWCDWNSGNSEDWISVTIATEGIPVEKVVNKVKFGLINENGGNGSIALPEDYYVEYYTGPLDYELDLSNSENEKVEELGNSHPLNDNSNWTEVEYIDNKPNVPENTDFRNHMEVSFEPVKTHLVRVRMVAQDGYCLGVDELEVYGSIASMNDDFVVEEISLNGENCISDFVDNTLVVELGEDEEIPEVVVNATNNASVTIVPPTVQNKEMIIKVIPESGYETGIEIYKIQFNGGSILEPIKSYSVHFDSNGGSYVLSHTVAEGNTVTEPKSPIRDGYIFTGWYTDIDLLNLFDFRTLIKSDITLYAGWKEKESGGDTGSGESSTPRYTIRAEAGKGGSISPEGSVSVTKGANKTFDITADKGYEISDVLVDGKSVGAVDTYTFEFVNTSHNIEAKFAAVVEEPDVPLGEEPDDETGDNETEDKPEITMNFKDVHEGDWYYNAVLNAYTKGLMSGTSSVEFSPNVKVTRGMIVTVLYRLAGEETVTSNAGFVDVSSDKYYAKAVSWASEKGIVSGYDAKHFGPEDNITREQLAAILYRYSGSPVVNDKDIKFADSNKVSAWAENSMAWAIENGILSGRTDGTLDPQGFATRAEVATVLMNFTK